MTKGIKIAKVNKSVPLASTIDLSMTSEAKSPIVAKEGIWSKSVSANNFFTVIIPHGLSYAPKHYQISGQKDVGETYRFNYPIQIGIATVTAAVRSDATNIYIDMYCGGVTTTGILYGYYYIYED
jgi:hypothetical protein